MPLTFFSALIASGCFGTYTGSTIEYARDKIIEAIHRSK